MVKQTASKRSQIIRIVIYIAFAALLVWLVIRERHSFGQAITAIKSADMSWLLLGIGAMLASVLATAAVYLALATKPLKFGRTVLVQAAGFCVNKLLPSGSGAVGTSYLYLRANGITTAQAAATVALNNVLGLIGHFILFWSLIALQPSALKSVKADHHTVVTAVQLFFLGLVLLVGLGIVLRDRLEKFTKPLKPVLNRPRAITKGLLASMVITLCYVVSLYASARAVGVDFSLAKAIIVLSGSVLATSVVPTPGGIGAAELGAYGGLVALGVDAKQALATALLYRVCTFWLPLIAGSGAFAWVMKQGYLRPVKATKASASR
jgi:uncharacterized membrane protein YbhN (UPF0104 family)